MNQSYSTENAFERQRLNKALTGLSDEDLHRPAGEGWTIADILAHLAFWDHYYLALVEKWEQAGFQPVSVNAEVVNQAARALSAAIPPHEAARLARTAADMIDRKVEQINPDLVRQIEANGQGRALRRALHRREHLDQIERALGERPVRWAQTGE